MAGAGGDRSEAAAVAMEALGPGERPRREGGARGRSSGVWLGEGPRRGPRGLRARGAVGRRGGVAACDGCLWVTLKPMGKGNLAFLKEGIVDAVEEVV